MANDIINKAKPGSIILLHDGYGISHDSVNSNKSNTVGIVELVVQNLLDKGYFFTTVSELLNIPPY
jgi:peptidoglycan/xylan/chitin deacetylase (PgdA/CDA1 family)